MAVKKGDQIYVDEVIIEKAMALKPSYLSKTGWINHLIDRGVYSLATTDTPADALCDLTLGGK